MTAESNKSSLVQFKVIAELLTRCIASRAALFAPCLSDTRRVTLERAVGEILDNRGLGPRRAAQVDGCLATTQRCAISAGAIGSDVDII